MIKTIDFRISELLSMKKYPNEIFYIGNHELLKKRKISIIGTRKPNSYTKEFTHKLASNVNYNNKLKYTKTNLNGITYVKS
ncbi:DNA-processing protein DprA [Aliarcobacter butzleri]|uniref:DNA-processing protein DprA n=1 Tax=Aliarcobacter butzleri TaxID=28197 RepID=UPI00263CC74A|nr:DNA-processing protein DprA [Aliarcobacter butzleri]MDN5073237.1 DNA-processing protein DprA [Aliarcobacter butzleri]MDN5120777.1 DNA-processing protein DprA [Aliarcobacter butzleri]